MRHTKSYRSYPIRYFYHLLNCSFLLIFFPIIKFSIDNVFELFDELLKILRILTPSEEILDISNTTHSTILMRVNCIDNGLQDYFGLFLLFISCEFIVLDYYRVFFDLVLDVFCLSKIVMIPTPQN
jgi:hypothetical protein